MRRRAAPPAQARADFLAGRLAARELLGPGFEVLNGKQGEPVVAALGGGAARVALSIAHSRGFGMAGISAGRGWAIGVDVESRNAMSENLTSRVLTRRELRRVARAGAAGRGRAALEHWVLKEAALKTMRGHAGVGLLRTPGAIEVVRLSRRGWGRVKMPGGGQARGRLIARSGVTMAVVLAPR
jgi:phosphopantetheinyl transferase